MIKLRCTQTDNKHDINNEHGNPDVLLQRVSEMTVTYDAETNETVVHWIYYNDETKAQGITLWCIDGDCKEEIVYAYAALKRIALNLQGVIFLPFVEGL